MSNFDKSIEFTPSIEDSQHFMAYYMENSPKLRKQRLIEGLVTGCIVLFGVFSCLYIAADISPAKKTELTVEHLISLGMLAFVLGLAVFILYPENRKKQILKNFEKVCNEDGNYTPQKWTLSFSEIEIKITSEMSTVMFRWEAVDKIIENGDYIYLDKGGNPIIIPKRAFEDDEHRSKFIGYIKQLHAAASSKTPAE